MGSQITPLRLAIFISGGGTTMESVLRACREKRLKHVHPVLVIASRSGAGGIPKAKAAGMHPADVVVLRKKDFPGNGVPFGRAILGECEKRSVHAIWQCGWSVLTPPCVVRAYEGRIFNQHPGPLDAGRPDFGGQNMRGLAVHEAVVQFSRRIRRFRCTQATVHRVTEKYDEGRIVGVRCLPILPDDSAETLAARLLPLEHELVIETIRDFALWGGLQELRWKKPLIRPREVSVLEAAKAAAIATYPHG